MGSFKNASDSNNSFKIQPNTDTHIHQKHIDPMPIISHTVASTSKGQKVKSTKLKKIEVTVCCYVLCVESMLSVLEHRLSMDSKSNDCTRGDGLIPKSGTCSNSFFCSLSW